MGLDDIMPEDTENVQIVGNVKCPNCGTEDVNVINRSMGNCENDDCLIYNFDAGNAERIEEEEDDGN